MKKSKAFRLSWKAVEALSDLVSDTGATETAIVEIALTHYRQAFKNARLEEVRGLSQMNINSQSQVIDSTIKQHKKRRRRK